MQYSKPETENGQMSFLVPILFKSAPGEKHCLGFNCQECKGEILLKENHYIICKVSLVSL